MCNIREMHPHAQLILTHRLKHLFHFYCTDHGIMFANGGFYIMHSPNVWARDGNVSLHLERFRHYFLVQNQTAATLTLNDINELLASSPCTFDHVPDEYIDCHILQHTETEYCHEVLPKAYTAVQQ